MLVLSGEQTVSWLQFPFTYFPSTQLSLPTLLPCPWIKYNLPSTGKCVLGLGYSKARLRVLAFPLVTSSVYFFRSLLMSDTRLGQLGSSNVDNLPQLNGTRHMILIVLFAASSAESVYSTPLCRMPNKVPLPNISTCSWDCLNLVSALPTCFLLDSMPFVLEGIKHWFWTCCHSIHFSLCQHLYFSSFLRYPFFLPIIFLVLAHSLAS